MPSDLIIETQTAIASFSLDGGCIASYAIKKDGTAYHILRPYQQESSVSFSPLSAASFPLIPYSNRIKHGKFTFDDQSYQLALNFADHPHSIHGTSWQKLWQIKEQSESQIILELNYISRGKTSGDWPFNFKAVQTFNLTGNDLTQQISVTNTGNDQMPLGLGMHPYFPKRKNTRLKANAPKVWTTDQTCLPQELVECPGHWDLNTNLLVENLECDNQFEPWDGKAQIHWPEDKITVDLSASSNLNRLIVYAPKNENFFCVEPTSHITNALNSSSKGMSLQDTGIHVLAPQKAIEGWMKFKVNAEF
ncbi:aldose 1-epimerase [Kiloniella sp. EL199]|uniref:aldose 1-epimerase n=1 Tax=Kiloniella sp. EL199 TaxID=2107581 RepID=UPI0013C47C9F|nr:aldose 1-epimerase [Kiloniella sp. EL199]